MWGALWHPAAIIQASAPSLFRLVFSGLRPTLPPRFTGTGGTGEK
jgi:hypothetical protein